MEKFLYFIKEYAIKAFIVFLILQIGRNTGGNTRLNIKGNKVKKKESKPKIKVFDIFFDIFMLILLLVCSYIFLYEKKEIITAIVLFGFAILYIVFFIIHLRKYIDQESI